MNNRLLVAFDDSENAMRAVEFITKYFTADHKITLFNVLPDSAVLCAMNSPELTPYFLSQKSSFCILDDKKKELIKEAMKKAEQKLVNAGFDKKNIQMKIKNRRIGIARDLIAEAQSGYDVVILGRRGLSGIKEFLIGSVSQKVLHSVKGVSVMIVD
ncbi:MAG: universal stress protein [Deltaproteobacteria bacterium]|nr:universal stress protein [Deltaproteobacteria bacterium]